MSAASQQNGVLKVLTFTGTQPFVVRCERDTRVKDIVGAIAEIWGFKEAARLFTLCHPAPGSDLTDPTKLLPGTLLSWTDRPCQVAAAAAAAAAAGSDSSHEATSVAAVTASLQPPPLLLVRYIFGSTAAEWDQNHSVLSLTAAQIAADVAAARYPGVSEAGLYQHWVKQGQHSVVLHMAASWPSGACLIVGPAHVLSGGAALQLGSAPINLGLNSKGMHIMMPHQHKLLLPLDSIASATPAGDVLNINFVSGQPDLLLQLPGTEAVAEAFEVHKGAAGPRPSTQPAPPEGSVSSAAGSGPASGKRGGPHMPLWITSPSVERWLQEPTPKDDGQAVSVAIQVLRPWEQTPPVLRVLLTPEETKPGDRLVEAQLLVVEEDADQDHAAPASTGADGGAEAQLTDAQDSAQQQPKQKQQRIKLQLNLLPQPPAAPEPRVKLTIAPVPAAEQELLMPAPGKEPLVRLVIKPRGERMGAGGSPNNMLRMLQKGAGAQPPGMTGAGPPGIDSSDGVMLRWMQLGVGAVIGDGLTNDERPHPQLMQRLQQQQQQQEEVRQGLLAGTHLGGNMGQGQGMRPAYSSRPTYASGYRPNMASSGMQPQPPGWGQQQYGSGMVSRPQGMRPMGAVGALPHQPYALVGPPGTVMGQQQAQHRPAMNQGHSQPRIMRPQHNHYPVHMQQPQQLQQPQQQQFAAMRQPQQVVMQQGGYMVVQQPQPQMQQAMMQQQQPQMAYAAMPQQQHQQPQQQQVMMLQANHNTAQPSNNMVLVTTADGRQLLVHESQLQQPQQQQAQQLAVQPALHHAQQQQVMSGVFVLGPHGELVPASQPAAAGPNAGMQQMVLQQQAQQPHQQQPMMVAQAQGQPMFVQPTPSQKLQQFQAQQMQQVQYQQPQQAQQQQRQMAGMAGLGATGQYDQLNLMAQQQQQQLPQQQKLMQAQPMGLMSMDMNGQLQAQQQQQQQQQQFMAVSSAQVGGQATQLLQLQGMQGMPGAATAVGGGQAGFVLQGQQPQQQQLQQQQQLLVANPGQQQQILVDSSNMGLLQQQMPCRSNGNMVMTSGAMFGQTVGGAPGLVSQSGPGSSGGGLGGLGLLQQQGMAGTNAPGLLGTSGSAAPGLTGISLGDSTLNNMNNTSMGMGGMSMGGLGGVGGLAAPGGNYLSSFDPLQQPNGQSSLNNTGLGVAAQTTADPPGLNYGSSGQKQGGFLQQQQQPQQMQQMQQPQQQMFTLGNAGVGGMTGLGVQDGMQGGLQVQGGLQGLQAGGLQAGGLQGTVLADGYMLTNDGMTLAGGAPGLDASAFGANQQLGQQFNATGFY